MAITTFFPQPNEMKKTSHPVWFKTEII